MLEFLKWLVARKEMAELERWRVEWHEHRRWLAEFPQVGMALDNMKSEVEGKPKAFISDLRERMRSLNREGGAPANKQSGSAAGDLLIVIAICGIFAAAALNVGERSNDQTEVLKTKDWQCLKTEDREYTYPTIVGKVMIQQTGTRSECVLWKRRDD